MRLRSVLVFITILMSIILSGCFGPSPAEKIYNHLEKSVTLEEVFEQQQKAIIELEKEERKLYEEIIQLGMAEFEQIQSLSKEALEIVDKRENRLNKEQESIQASQKEFELIKPIIDEIEDEKVKSKATQLYEVMQKRYGAYQQLYQHYSEAISFDRELYQMFQDKELTLQELEEQIHKINDSYDKVVEMNEKFNNYTEEYNQLKREFYEIAGLNVEFNEIEKE